jgi:hypothetical protein
VYNGRSEKKPEVMGQETALIDQRCASPPDLSRSTRKARRPEMSPATGQKPDVTVFARNMDDGKIGHGKMAAKPAETEGPAEK